MDIDEIIHLSPYQAQWKDVYAAEKRILQSLFGEKVRLEHIGSTSVEGMTAKPVVDIMVGLDKLVVDETIETQLVKLGYCGFGEAGVPGRLYYRKREGHSVNLQVTVLNSNLWNDNLLFRDYLRAHPAAALRYAEHKERIMEKGIHTLLKYSDEKFQLISELMQEAREWSQGR